MRTTVSLGESAALAEGRHGDPHHVLGPHEIEHAGRRAVAIRAFAPGSRQGWVVHRTSDEGQSGQNPMRRIHPAGLFEAVCPGDALPSANSGDRRRGAGYQLCFTDQHGRTATMHDPYAFPKLLSDYDLHLLGEGSHWRSYERLGAQLRKVDNVSGVNFAVWAPNADGVGVAGDFNDWDGRRHAMRRLDSSGVWELFVPDIGAGAQYKFQIRDKKGAVHEKCDPYGFAAEMPPRTASKVADLNAYRWTDQQWLEQRAATDWLSRPLSFYEVHLGSWRRPGDDPDRWLGYRELAHQLGEYCLEMGYTHIELMPVAEHPLTASWGYQVVGYYAVTSRYGSPEDFMYLVDYLHGCGVGVILDWVPAHFPKDGHGLRQFDGTSLYEHSDPRQGEHPDWGTLIFNYGRNEVRNFLVSNALFWLDKYHIDGLRVDAVASMLYLDYSREGGDWVPNRFGGRENLEAIEMIKEFNEQVHLQFPGVLTIAEESTAWGGVSRPTYTGGLGFSLKWNMGWMNDTLSYMRHEPVHRSYHHDELTFSLIYAFTENFTLPLSHDEVVHGKGSLLDQVPGDLWQKFANLRLLYTYMWCHPGKKLLFMGGDFGQWNEWNHDDSLQWDLLRWDSHAGLKRLVADLNALYRREEALSQIDFDAAGFEWIDCHDHDDSTLSFIRKAEDPNNFLVVACNFTPVPRHDYRLGVSQLGWYEEIFNSDSKFYAGSNIGNAPGAQAEEIPYHGRPYSLPVTLPPLSAVVLKPRHG